MVQSLELDDLADVINLWLQRLGNASEGQCSMSDARTSHWLGWALLLPLLPSAFCTATSSSTATFCTATSSSTATFCTATSSSTATFCTATSSSTADFYAATRSSTADFYAATRSSTADFYAATRSSTADFYAAASSTTVAFYAVASSTRVAFYAATNSTTAAFFFFFFFGVCDGRLACVTGDWRMWPFSVALPLGSSCVPSLRVDPVSAAFSVGYPNKWQYGCQCLRLSTCTCTHTLPISACDYTRGPYRNIRELKLSWPEEILLAASEIEPARNKDVHRKITFEEEVAFIHFAQSANSSFNLTPLNTSHWLKFTNLIFSQT